MDKSMVVARCHDLFAFVMFVHCLQPVRFVFDTPYWHNNVIMITGVPRAPRSSARIHILWRILGGARGVHDLTEWARGVHDLTQ